jgi:hypothetical protein
MISDDQAEAAVLWIAKFADEVGQRRGVVEQTKHAAKTQEACIFLESEGTVADRNAKAQAHASVITAWEQHSNAVADYETARTKLKAKELTVEVWRTQAANSRMWHV